MRIRYMPPFLDRPLTVAIASKISGARHAGAIVSTGGHWLLDGKYYRNEKDLCGGRGSAGCRAMQQVRVLGHFRAVAAEAGYRGEMTVLTASRAVADLLNAWLEDREQDLDWYAGDAARKRRMVCGYPGRLQINLSPSGHSLLVDFARELNGLILDVHGQSREQITTRANDMVYTKLGIS